MALCSEAKICLLSFLSTSSLSLVYLVSTLFQTRSFIWKSSFAFIVLSTIIANALILAYLYRTRLDLYEVRVGGVGAQITFWVYTKNAKLSRPVWPWKQDHFACAEVKTPQLSPAMLALSQAPWGLGFPNPMTGANVG